MTHKKKTALTRHSNVQNTNTTPENDLFMPKHVVQCTFNKNCVNIIVMYITTEIQ